MPPNGLLKSIGAAFKDGLFRRVKARHREIHQELTAVDWRGPITHIPKNPIIINTKRLKDKILKAGEQRHNLKMAQLQKVTLLILGKLAMSKINMKNGKRDGKMGNPIKTS